MDSLGFLLFVFSATLTLTVVIVRCAMLLRHAATGHRADDSGQTRAELDELAPIDARRHQDRSCDRADLPASFLTHMPWV